MKSPRDCNTPSQQMLRTSCKPIQQRPMQVSAGNIMRQLAPAARRKRRGPDTTWLCICRLDLTQRRKARSAAAPHSLKPSWCLQLQCWSRELGLMSGWLERARRIEVNAADLSTDESTINAKKNATGTHMELSSQLPLPSALDVNPLVQGQPDQI